ncbi:MAG: hypothetical protein IPP42_07440 [Saprospiraceae bacterium]|nr:hypothetical protein [Saprospiraceae bacterium]
MSIMGSLFDIGPLTSKRFSSDTVSIGKIYLKEILAPGVHGSLGIGKRFPISFNVGYQQFPLLRKVGSASDLVNKHGLSLSVNVNIPILTLVNKNGSTIKLINESRIPDTVSDKIKEVIKISRQNKMNEINKIKNDEIKGEIK